MRVQALLASHDKDDLCSEVEDVKTHLARAEKIGSEAQEQLKQARNEIDSLRNSLRVQLREIEHLKASIRMYSDKTHTDTSIVEHKRTTGDGSRLE